MIGKVMDTLAEPSPSMSWAQLAGATVFVITVAIAWRQVVHFIMDEY